MRKIGILIVAFLSALYTYSQQATVWGDQGNGTFINPVLNADYSDPDIIRVENKYYMVCSEFHYIGMTIQESDDMVNWKIIGRIYDRIDRPTYDNMEAYGSGSWAPSIRYHDGKFYVYFCTPDDGLFVTTAKNPEGPWEPLYCMVNTAGWEDPCPFWDDNGEAYLGRSKVGAGPIIIHRMSKDGKTILDEGITVYEGKIAEGTKIHKLNGYYYFSIPEGGVTTGWQTVLRSKNIYGPYEKRIVLEQGATDINGPHQGALVEALDGEWWFYHFQMVRGIGRVMHLQPVFWQDEWPVIGVDINRNGIGEPVYVWRKPNIEKSHPIALPQASDEFTSSELGLQWQWNHNPVNNRWSLSKRSGWLSLEALQAPNLKTARNTLTQKIMGNCGEAIVQMDASDMKSGQKAGLVSMSNIFNAVGVVNKQGKLAIFFNKDGKENVEINISEKVVNFKLNINIFNREGHFTYSLDDENYTPIGSSFKLTWRDWKGSRIGLFSYNELTDGGIATFNYIHYRHDGPVVEPQSRLVLYEK
jgi:beta-xylosidase